MEDIINTAIKRKGKTVAIKSKHVFIKQLLPLFFLQFTFLTVRDSNESRNSKLQ